MKEKTVRIATHILIVLLAIIGTVLSISDKITALPLPPQWSKYWGAFIGVAVLIKPILLTIGDYLDDGIINKSFKGWGIPVICVGIIIGSAGCVSAHDSKEIKQALRETDVSVGVNYGGASVTASRVNGHRSLGVGVDAKEIVRTLNR